MSASEAPNGSEFNPFVVPSDSYQRGWVLDLRQVFDGILRPQMEASGRTAKTINSIDRHLREFEEWWAMLRSQWEGRKNEMDFDRPLVAGVRHDTLLAFQKHLIQSGKSASFTNKTLGAVKRILKCAAHHQLIPQAPQIADLPEHKSDPPIYLTDDQLTALWHAAERLAWPKKRRGFRPLGYPAATAWRCCLVLWVMYGIRTQDLITLEGKNSPLTWGNFYDDPATPNPVGYATNQDGWLHFTPSKSKRFGRPLYLPLNRHARSAIERLRPDDWKPDMAICDWTFSSTSFYDTWHEWVRLAGIKHKSGQRFLVKHLRNTCVTRIEKHRTGLSIYIVGHTPDQIGSGMRPIPRSKVSDLHYHNPEDKIVECISTIKLPSCFDSILMRLSPTR